MDPLLHDPTVRLTSGRSLTLLRPYLEGAHGELLRMVLSTASLAEANLALGLLEDHMPERDLVSAANLREVLAELPSCPFAMALEIATLARVASLRRNGTSWVFERGAATVGVIAEGNLCFDIVLNDGERGVLLKPHATDTDLVPDDALDLLVAREGMLEAVVSLVKDMGAVFSPRFYLSLEDWKLDHAADMMSDAASFF